MITCINCKISKPDTDFYKDKHCKRGRKTQCKECIRNKVELKYEDELSNIPEIDEVQDFEDIFGTEESPSTLIVAPRGSGKTNFLNHIYPLLRKNYDMIIFFCKNLQSPAYWFLDENDLTLSFDDYKPDVIRILKYIQRQTSNFFRILFLFDDCSDMAGNKYSRQITDVFITGRNNRSSIMFCTQDPTFVAKTNRHNTDFIIAFDPKDSDLSEALVNAFLRYPLKAPDTLNTNASKMRWYVKYIEQHTEDFKMVIIDKNRKEIKKYKAPKMVNPNPKLIF